MDRPHSGLLAKPIAIFEEGRAGDDEEDDIELVTETVPAFSDTADGAAKGVLVKDILEAEKGLKVYDVPW